MAKISRHGGPSVSPGEDVVIRRPEIGFMDQAPVAEDISEAAQKDRDALAAEEKAIEQAKGESKTPVKKATGKK